LEKLAPKSLFYSDDSSAKSKGLLKSKDSMKPNKDFNEKDVKNDVGFDSISKESTEVKKVTICIQVVMIILHTTLCVCFFA
jgi:hypothetical protein